MPVHRGTEENPPNRFEALHLEPDADADQPFPDEEPRPVPTEYLVDHSASLITYNDSPDISFDASINPYRGCEHGCVYCYARPTHEFAGFSPGLDFETKILVKKNAPELLRRELESPKWKPQVIACSGVTDCYQPIERRLRLTRQCLEILAEFKNPVGIVTKNSLVTRDIDLLERMTQWSGSAVWISVTTLDTDLRRRMEPRTAPPASRMRTIQHLSDAGIPTGVLIAPVIPGLNDIEIPEILNQASAAGATFAGYTILRLPYAVSDLFTHWLARHYPLKKDKILAQIRSLRAGHLNDSKFGRRQAGTGTIAQQIRQLFQVSKRRAGFPNTAVKLDPSHFTRRLKNQPELF